MTATSQSQNSHNSSNSNSAQKLFFNNQSCTGGSKSQGEKIFLIKAGNGGVTRIGVVKRGENREGETIEADGQKDNIKKKDGTAEHVESQKSTFQSPLSAEQFK